MASKDKQTGSWVAQWYEVDAYGKKKHRKSVDSKQCVRQNSLRRHSA